MIKIDGSYGEGGGQIIRTALALSTVLQVPFRVENIRKGRDQPGLKAQHIACIRALQKLCNAKVDGDEIGSDFLLYVPGEIKARSVEVDIGTAGSITLLLQSLLVPCFLAGHPVKLTIKGGTSGKWQMPFDYFNNVFKFHLYKYGEIKSLLVKRGYYSKGGGLVELKIKPRYTLENRDEAPKIMLEEKKGVMHIRGISHASMILQDSEVAERQARAAKAFLADLNCHIDIRAEYCDTLSIGSGITLWVVFSEDEINDLNPIIIGADTIGEKGKTSESVGTEAAKMLLNELNKDAPVDSHLADNLIPFLALFGGVIRTTEITDHTLSNIYASEQFFGKRFEINKEEKIIKTI